MRGARSDLHVSAGPAIATNLCAGEPTLIFCMERYGAAKVLDFDMEYLLFQNDISLRSCTALPNYSNSMELGGLFEITRKKVL